MTTPALPTPAETVAVAWLKSGPAPQGVATALPKDPLTWPQVGDTRIFVQVTDISGTPDPYTRQRQSALQWDVWAARPNSNRMPWSAAASVAEILLGSTYTWPARDLSADLPPQYAASRVQSLWPTNDPRRITDDPSGYARYTLDVRMAWIMLSGEVQTTVPYSGS